jgi:hypothetical protein
MRQRPVFDRGCRVCAALFPPGALRANIVALRILRGNGVIRVCAIKRM